MSDLAPPRSFSTSSVEVLAASNVSFLLVFEGNYWNAASFSSPASYLHFPLYRGETCSDVSFYFKTSSTHGVFVENQGADFFHIELRGECLKPTSPDLLGGPHSDGRANALVGVLQTPR